MTAFLSDVKNVQNLGNLLNLVVDMRIVEERIAFGIKPAGENSGVVATPNIAGEGIADD